MDVNSSLSSHSSRQNGKADSEGPGCRGVVICSGPSEACSGSGWEQHLPRKVASGGALVDMEEGKRTDH